MLVSLKSIAEPSQNALSYEASFSEANEASLNTKLLQADDKEFQAWKKDGLLTEPGIEKHSEHLGLVLDVWSKAGDTSNLILDPDVDSYYLMDIMLLQVPAYLRELQELILVLKQELPENSTKLTPEVRFKLDLYLNGLAKIEKSVFASFKKTTDDNSELRTTLASRIMDLK